MPNNTCSEVINMFAFMEAQRKAETTGKHEFVCPGCGGIATWERAKSNGHLHTRCKKCGYKIME